MLSDHRYADAAHYLVLESFDMLRGSLDGFLDAYYQGADYTDLLVRAGELGGLREHLAIIRTGAARSKVLQATEALRAGELGRIVEIGDQICRLCSVEDRGPMRTAIDTLMARSESSWYIVSDLWDYIPEWKAV